jgi:hypothetical protein
MGTTNYRSNADLNEVGFPGTAELEHESWSLLNLPYGLTREAELEDRYRRSNDKDLHWRAAWESIVPRITNWRTTALPN